MYRENSTDVNNNLQQQQQGENKKLQHRLKSKMLLLFPFVLLAVTCIIALSIGQIVSDQSAAFAINVT